ncbi:MAG: phosphoenolpyruvate--protein phosphotransferase, partial [Bacteroidetes bacterium]|nr:phosphoenolpyruvate--protein phosphotransferase [Bacteroidota bacterium]
AGTNGSSLCTGIGVSPGIAIGPAYLYARIPFEVQQRAIDPDLVGAETARFEQAIRRAERDLHKIIAVTREKLGEGSASIFEAQLLMLRDEAMYPEVISCIEQKGINAGFAVQSVMSKHRQIMEASDSEYLRERSNDLLDIQDRIIRHLRRGRILSAVDEDSIVIAENLTAADIILFSRRGILGCATDFGGPTSHVSIMARALGVPAVVSTHGATAQVATGDLVILDGIRGELLVNPDEATLERYRVKQKRYKRLLQEDKQLVGLPAETLDGHPVLLQANLELKEEIPLMAENGAQGVGLFRTEMLLLMEGRAIVTEEEQTVEYTRVVEAVAPHTTTFRILDLGGDKLLPMGHREHNPFLGWRGIRILLDKPELLVPQLRAILRASAHGPTRILLPMITRLSEVRQFKQILAETMDTLATEGVPFDRTISVGVMVEVPSVALQADLFAAEVDFFSIGTNDLTQYVLAVDRGNDLVAEIYNELHPAVLELIRMTAEAAHNVGIPVSLCGELATNLRAVPVLLGLGVDSLSASPVYLPAMKRVIRAMKRSEGKALAARALASSDPEDFRRFMDRWLEEHACGVSFFLEGADG